MSKYDDDDEEKYHSSEDEDEGDDYSEQKEVRNKDIILFLQVLRTKNYQVLQTKKYNPYIYCTPSKNLGTIIWILPSSHFRNHVRPPVHRIVLRPSAATL